MNTHFIRTKQGTDFEEDISFGTKLLKALLFFIPRGNPGYDGKLHLIDEWLVEFDENGLPGREIGLDKCGNIVVAGPNEKDYGFWLDTNMKYTDFKGEEVAANTFERLWHESESYRNNV